MIPAIPAIPGQGGASNGETQDITLKVWCPQNQIDTGAMDQMEKAFAEAHPEWNITWKNEVVGEDKCADELLKDVGNSADVFLFANDQLPKLVEAGAIERDPIKNYVAAVSAGIVGDAPLLDLCYEEDSRAMVDLNCVMNERGELVELQGTGEVRGFTAAEQRALVDLCAGGIRELMEKQKEILGGRF